MVIAADKWGKIKTVTQDVAIVLLLMGNWPFRLIGIPMDHIVLIASTVLTVVSGANYIVKNTAVFKSGDAFKEKTENDAEAARKKVCRQLLEGGITVSAAESFLLAAGVVAACKQGGNVGIVSFGHCGLYR